MLVVVMMMLMPVLMLMLMIVLVLMLMIVLMLVLFTRAAATMSMRLFCHVSLVHFSLFSVSFFFIACKVTTCLLQPGCILKVKRSFKGKKVKR